jgi:hypothetical protein
LQNSLHNQVTYFLVDCFIGTINTVVVLKGDNVPLLGVSNVNPHDIPPTIYLNPDPEEPALTCPQGGLQESFLDTRGRWSNGVVE